MRNSPPLTLARLKEVVSYNHDTGVFYRLTSCNHCNIGDVAGCLDQYGYMKLMIDGRTHLQHRLAWLYVFGELPAKHLDHINRDRKDNRISNLRVADDSQNQCNTGLSVRNTSGFKGVHQRSGRFVASIKKRGESFYLGSYDTAEEAHAAYVTKAKELHGEFARTK